MAVVRRVRRLVNPSRSTGGTKRRRRKGRNPRSRHRRRLTPAQIKAGFGGKRAQSASKRRRRVKANPKRRHKRRANPVTKTRVVYRTKTKVKYRTRIKRVRAKSKHRRRKSNPGLLVTMGPALAGNPRKRRSSSVARKRKRKASNPRRRHHRRRANPAKVVYRYRGRKRSRRNSSRRRRNPSGFGGGMGLKSGAKAIVFGLAGVTVTKTASAMLPASVVSSPLMRVVASAALAWGGGALVSKWDKDAGNAFMFGGFMQAGSVALNAFLPQIGSVIGLQGLRGLVPSNDILLPYNPFLGRGAMVASGAPGSAAVAGARGFAPAFA